MSRYICLECGLHIYRKKDMRLHKEVHPEHTILEKSRRSRFNDFLLDAPWGRLFRGWGVWIICAVMDHHFQLHFSFWEVGFLAIGIGFMI